MMEKGVLALQEYAKVKGRGGVGIKTARNE